MPTSASASAGASLMPSPTMATGARRRVASRCFSSATMAALSSGSTSARTSSMPSSRPTACALPALSPLTSTVAHALRPCSCRRPPGRGAHLEGLAEASRPWGAAPSVDIDSHRNDTVRPCDCSSWRPPLARSVPRSKPAARPCRVGCPGRKARPSTCAARPRPATALSLARHRHRHAFPFVLRRHGGRHGARCRLHRGARREHRGPVSPGAAVPRPRPAGLRSACRSCRTRRYRHGARSRAPRRP